MACSPSLTCTAPKPMNPPSFAASAAACAAMTNQPRNASVSAGVAFPATIASTALSSSRTRCRRLLHSSA
jgi:hypothetical protein